MSSSKFACPVWWLMDINRRAFDFIGDTQEVWDVICMVFSHWAARRQVGRVGSLASIMHPDAKAPLLASYEVGVVVGHTQVVNRLLLAGVAHLLHRHPPPVVARQQVARRQRAGPRPALAP